MVSHVSPLSGNNPATNAAVSAPSPTLVRAAHEFEAAMMKELLAPMVGNHSGSDDEQQSGSASALGDFAGEALGKALSERGGFGIATQIIHQLMAHPHAKSNQVAAATVPQSVTQNGADFSHK